jgi:hypothetical protein
MENTWDFVEVEVKVIPEGRGKRLVELAQWAAPPGSRMIRKPHVAFFDLYFDSKEFGLAKNEAYLRARFSKSSFRKKGTYKLYYKDNAMPQDGIQFLSRREVRSDLNLDEILRYSNGRLPGNAADLAYEVLTRAGRKGPLVATCLISSFRRYFTMRTSDPAHSDILNLGLEQSTAFAARDIDVDLLLHSGFLDTPLTSPTYDFEVAEAEVTAENYPPADEMFKKLITAFAKEFRIVTDSKYLSVLDKLGLLRDKATQ